MLLTLQLKKGKGKPSTLTCIRADGSSTWTKLQRGMEMHDLAHYAVESELEFRDAFYGIVNRGFQVGDFELPRDRRPRELIPANLPVEAIQTEHIVNLLQIEYFNTGAEDPDFLANLANILEQYDLPFPEELDEAALQRIRKTYHDLVSRWMMLPPGEMLELEMNIPD
jgi:hypothetical protein